MEVTEKLISEVVQVFDKGFRKAYELNLSYEDKIRYQLTLVLKFLDEKEKAEYVFNDEVKVIYLRNLYEFYGVEYELQDFKEWK